MQRRGELCEHTTPPRGRSNVLGDHVGPPAVVDRQQSGRPRCNKQLLFWPFIHTLKRRKSSNVSIPRPKMPKLTLKILTQSRLFCPEMIRSGNKGVNIMIGTKLHQMHSQQEIASDRFHRLVHNAPTETVPHRVLITGGLGQLGRSLAQTLAHVLGPERVLLSDICRRPADLASAFSYRYLDILDRRAMDRLVVDEQIDLVVHFSALLSALGEQNVEMALQVNCQGVQNVLQVAKCHQLRLFLPSTIGVFGQSTPRQQTPDVTVQRPSTIYGVSKVFAELLGEYFWLRFGTDFRSLRLPGIISTAQPGGGTTDYAIQMFWDAVQRGRHICFLRPDTQLPMLYEEDCMAALLGILLAPSDSLRLRTYNVAGFSCTPAQLAAHIQRHLPHFQVHYEPCPVRQRIADTWPQSLDDSTARIDWGWRPHFTLDKTVREMLQQLGHPVVAEAMAQEAGHQSWKEAEKDVVEEDANMPSMIPAAAMEPLQQQMVVQM